MNRRLGRRSLLAGGAAVGGIAVVSGVAIRASRDGGQPVPPPAPKSTGHPAVTASPVPTATPPPSGGSVALAAPSTLQFDTFDAALTGEASVVEILGRTHSRILQWDDFQQQTLAGDLAATWEQPDPLTLTLHVAPTARWHDRPPLDGAAVTAEDIVGHIDRLLALAAAGNAPLVQDQAAYATVEAAHVLGPSTVQLRLSAPDPYILSTLAGEFALVQAPSAVEAFAARWPDLDPATVTGSGAWTYQGQAGDFHRFQAAPSGHLRPLLDALEVTAPFDLARRFAAGEIDEALSRDRRETDALRAAGPSAQVPQFEREAVLSTFATGSPPWDSPQLLQALSASLNRRWLIRQLFAGRAAPSGPVPPVHGELALGDDALSAYPGYAESEANDARTARALWEAAGGPGLGIVVVDFPSVFDPLYSASSVVIARLNEVLGQQFRPAVETYTQISRRVASGYYGQGRAAFWFGWGPRIPSPDPRRAFLSLYPGVAALGSTVTPAEAGLALRAAQRQVLDGGFEGVIPWVQQTGELFRRTGLYGPAPTPFWTGHMDHRRYRDS